MAIVKLEKNGYGQVELNQVAFRRDGRIEAQCALNAAEFPANGSTVAENGMLFAVDKVKRELKKATGALAANHVIGLNYSSEHMYDERKTGLKDFALTGGVNVFPRLGFLAAGDRFTTNTVCYNSETYVSGLTAVKEALEAGTPVYAGVASDGCGYWELAAEAPAAGPIATVAEVTTMPDGQPAVKLIVVKA